MFGFLDALRPLDHALWEVFYGKQTLWRSLVALVFALRDYPLVDRYFYDWRRRSVAEKRPVMTDMTAAVYRQRGAIHASLWEAGCYQAEPTLVPADQHAEMERRLAEARTMDLDAPPAGDPLDLMWILYHASGRDEWAERVRQRALACREDAIDVVGSAAKWSYRAITGNRPDGLVLPSNVFDLGGVIAVVHTKPADDKKSSA